MSRRELLKGSTATLLLTLVADGPIYGYQMVQEMERRSDGYFSFKEGTLYPALHRLERTGLIHGKWQEAPTGQLRRYYYMTEKGRQALAQLQEEWHQFARAVNRVIQPQPSGG